MWAAVIQAGIMLGTFVYHRTRNPTAPPRDRDVKIPLTEEGAIIPLIFGRCRVRAPVLAWIGDVQTSSGDVVSGVNSGTLLYRASAFFALGIPFEDGLNRVHSMYVGEEALINTLDSPGGGAIPGDLRVQTDELEGDGAFEYDTRRCSLMKDPVGVDLDTTPSAGGWVEFLNGNTTQNIVDPGTLAATTTLGERMVFDVDSDEIPGYRGFMSVFLYGIDPPDPDAGFNFGMSPQIPAVSFEASSYPFDALTADRIGLDANPADVIYHLLKDHLGKLGLDYTRVDYTTFLACALTLDDEGHGYSRAIEDGTDTQEAIDEVLRQIDGVLYEDPLDGLFKLRLIRADFDPATILRIDPSNCEGIENFAAGGWTNVPNKIRVVFTDRHAGYVEGSATAQNQANAVGQNGQVREIVLNFPGICTQALADEVAGRELSARSRPIAKFRVIVDRSFWRVVEGDALLVNFPEYNISGMVVRAAHVSRRGPDSNSIAIDVIQDFFYVHRRIVYGLDAVAPFPGSGGLLVE